MHRSPSRLFAPLPGTTPRPKGLFLDRWGTLLRLPDLGYGTSATDVVFPPGVLDALFRASRSGWNVYLLGNEEEVARGKVSAEAWEAIQQATLGSLEEAGVPVTRDYSCAVHPEGVGAFCGDSVYQLPNTGAFYHASHADGVQLEKSWVVGDSTLELAAGWRAGLRLAAVRSGLGLSDRTLHVEPEIWAEDLCEVLAVLTGTGAQAV